MVAEIIENDEEFAVEFKSTARWVLRMGGQNKAMEDAVVETVAGFLNTDGGTLLIGVGPDREAVGLGHDYPRVKPPTGDGFVNWLTTHLTTAVGHAADMRTQARIAVHEGHEICRLDVARPSRPVWVRTSRLDRVLYVRMNKLDARASRRRAGALHRRPLAAIDFGLTACISQTGDLAVVTTIADAIRRTLEYLKSLYSTARFFFIRGLDSYIVCLCRAVAIMVRRKHIAEAHSGSRCIVGMTGIDRHPEGCNGAIHVSPRRS
jgi:hypothetical protein